MKGHLPKQLLVVVGILMAAVFTAVYVKAQPRLAPGQIPLVDIKDIETLRAQFNQDIGQPRLVVLFSPT